MPSLPGELILLILEENYFDHKFRSDRRFLLNCCQVSRLWAAEAQPLLFRHVEVRTPSSFEGLKVALTESTPRRAALKGVVLWLRMWIGCSKSVSPPKTLSFLLSICPNLYGLSVTFRDMWTISEIPRLPSNIVALECCDWEGSLGFEISRIIVRSGWHSVRFLTLRGYAVAPHRHLQDLSPNLLELRLGEPYNVPYDPGMVTGTDISLSLRVLDVPDECCSIAEEVIRLSSHSLESIRIPNILLHLYSVIAQCLQLKELRFEGSFRRPLVDILRKLPLEHLAFVIDQPRESSFEDSLEGISKSGNLRVVSCLSSLRPWNYLISYYMDNLECLCIQKGIRLDIYNNLSAFRRVTRGDPVLAERFPRPFAVPSHSRLTRKFL